MDVNEHDRLSNITLSLDTNQSIGRAILLLGIFFN